MTIHPPANYHAVAEHANADYPECAKVCDDYVNFGAAGIRVSYNILRDLSSLTVEERRALSSEISADIDNKSLIIDIASPVNGTINVELRWFLTATSADKSQRTSYTVLVDGQSVPFDELGRKDIYEDFAKLEYLARKANLDESRILAIDFARGNHMIEIIGTDIVIFDSLPTDIDWDPFAYRDFKCSSYCLYNLTVGQTAYPIPYTIVGEIHGESESVKVDSISPDFQRKSLVASITAKEFGTFAIQIPRYILQSAATDGKDLAFTVLVDGKETTKFHEDNGRSEPFNTRGLYVDFPNNTKRIEIVGNGIKDPQQESNGESYFPCETLSAGCTFDLTVGDRTFDLKYAIRGDERAGDKHFPRIEEVYVYKIENALYFYISSPYQGGHLILEPPPELIQASREDNSRYAYFDYEDFRISPDWEGNSMEHTNIITNETRILDISFDNGTSEISVIGTWVYGKGAPVGDFPCISEEGCTYRNLEGQEGTLYDIRYKIGGWRNFGYPDNIKVNSMMIDENKRSLVVNITANQKGFLELQLDDEILEEQLAGDYGINYFASIDGTEQDATWTAQYYPDKPTRLIGNIDFERGSEQIEIFGLPMERYPCEENGEHSSEFCLYEATINGEPYPIVYRYSGQDPQRESILRINNVTVNEDRKSIIFDMSSSQSAFLQLIPTERLIDEYIRVIINGNDANTGSDNLEGQNNVWLFIPQGKSKVELIGTTVLPEFGSIAPFVMAAATVGAIIAFKRFRIRQYKPKPQKQM